MNLRAPALWTYALVWLLLQVRGLATLAAAGAVIHVAPGDSYARIEAAQPGDEVVIAPGTYGFRLYLTRHATPEQPIIIRAEDPAHPPVWDFGTSLLEDAPGSHTAGDRGRGAWQFSGAKNYSVSGIVFRNCHNAAFNAAGIRYFNGTTNLWLCDCLFTHNDNGLTGGDGESGVTVEGCEFAANGNPKADAPTHNLYIYGGTFTMRYCYVHDSVQAENFHVRARHAVLEYNWFARGKSYEGDLMTDVDFRGPGPFSQLLTVRGNVFVQHPQADNHGQVLALHNDSHRTNLTLSARLLYNTFIGNGGHAAFVHLANADGTRMQAEVSDNIIYGTTLPTLVDKPEAGTVAGVNNWLPLNAAPGPLTHSVQTPSPGFRNLAGKDYTLAPGSACIGAADVTVEGLPDKEYYRNEGTNRLWRMRTSAKDLGAIESTTTTKPAARVER